MQIGKFTKVADGSFTGFVSTKNLDIEAVLVANERAARNPKAPAFNVMMATRRRTCVGAAWVNEGKPDEDGEIGEYISIKFEDPSFRAFYANLVQDPEGDKDKDFVLLYSERQADIAA